MSVEQRQGLVKKSRLTDAEFEAIKQLSRVCEAEEQIHLRIDWSMLRRRSGQVDNDFLYYADDELVGYLALDDSGGAENELMGMVHPAYRRRGIFTLLMKAAYEECKTRDFRHLILICERSSPSGLAFIKALHATYSESEHEMVLTQMPARGAFDERLVMHKADISDLDALIRIQSESFGQLEERARLRITRCMQQPEICTYYLAVFGDPDVGCREPVGSLRLNVMDDTIGVYAFGVRPAYQGRGYGRQILEEAIQIIRTQGQQTIMLDVDVENERAIHLYRSCGFTVRATYDYYIVAL